VNLPNFVRIAMLACALLLLATASASARPSNKWRIEVSEGAKSDGEIVFHLTPESGEPIEVSVSVAKGTGENAVAQRIRDVMRQTLGPAAYHIEVDDGEDVLVKKKKGQPNFDLTLVRNTVKATRINIDRE
jgi:hypothetical protein